jgi:nitrogen fixation protein NifU and related proteins
MSSDLDDLYQEVLLDHSKRPRNFGEIAEGAVHVHGDNPSCGDEIDLYVRFGPEQRIEEIKFTGQGCAISRASASMMTLKLRGQTREEAERLLHSFRDLVTTDPTGQADPPRAMGDLRLLGGVRRFPQRVKCAMLAWRAFEQALGEGGDATASTE